MSIKNKFTNDIKKGSLFFITERLSTENAEVNFIGFMQTLERETNKDRSIALPFFFGVLPFLKRLHFPYSTSPLNTV